MNPINFSRGDLHFDGTLNVWDGAAWIPVTDPKVNAVLPAIKRTKHIIPIAFGAFFAGCLIFGLGHFLLAPRVHGACALNATPYGFTYSQACHHD